MLFAVVLSLAAGVLMVLARVFNGRFAEETNARLSTFYNFMVGFAGAMVVYLLSGEKAPATAGGPPPLWLFAGGTLGVLVLGGLALNLFLDKKKTAGEGGDTA